MGVLGGEALRARGAAVVRAVGGVAEGVGVTAVPLQTRILSVIREHQPVPVKDLPHWLPEVDAIALDCGVTALMRANKLSRVNGYYDLINGQPKLNGADHANGQGVEVAREAGNLQVRDSAPARPSEAKAVEPDRSAPPTAAEEAAASLNGQEPLFDCEQRLALEQVRAVLTYLEGQFPEAFA